MATAVVVVVVVAVAEVVFEIPFGFVFVEFFLASYLVAGQADLVE